MPINLSAYTFLFTIAAIGISEAAYLVEKRKAAEKPVCPIGHGCEEVLNSKYNRLFGIHNDILGLAFYAVSAFILGFIVINGDNSNTRLLSYLFYFMLGGATTMSAVFIFLQSQVIKAWCFWCVMSGITIFLMDVIVIISYLKFT